MALRRELERGPVKDFAGPDLGVKYAHPVGERSGCPSSEAFVKVSGPSVHEI